MLLSTSAAGEGHLRHFLRAYANFYNRRGTYLALAKDAPLRRPVQANRSVVALPLLGGLHHRYAVALGWAAHFLNLCRRLGLKAHPHQTLQTATPSASSRPRYANGPISPARLTHCRAHLLAALPQLALTSMRPHKGIIPEGEHLAFNYGCELGAQCLSRLLGVQLIRQIVGHGAAHGRFYIRPVLISITWRGHFQCLKDGRKVAFAPF
jgi:hypothetical protein